MAKSYLPAVSIGGPEKCSIYTEEARAKAMYRREFQDRLIARKDQAKAFMQDQKGEVKGGIFFSQSAAALRGEMYRLFTQDLKVWQGKASDSEFMVQVLITVRERYIRHCSFWRVKPNSQALACIEGAEVVETTHAQDEKRTRYDFSTCNLGDRGTVCVLLALAHDPFVGFVSLKGCGIRQACAPVLAEFLKLHPNLEDVNLENNDIGFAAGNLLLSALRRRDRRSSLHDGMNADVKLNLATTPLSFGRCGGPTEPPSGFTSPEPYSARKYELLQKKFDLTGRVRWLKTPHLKTINVIEQFDGV